MSCPAGFHPRRAYTVKRTGTRVAGSCVRTTTKREPRANFVAKTRRRMTRRLQGYRLSQRGVTSCPKGTIVRDAYVRKRFGRKSLVPASCIRDLGNPGKGFPGKGPGIGPLRKGVLSRYGYAKVKTLSVADRRAALSKAIKADGSLTVWRHLNALYVYMKRTAPTASKIFKADRDWIRDTYGIKAF